MERFAIVIKWDRRNTRYVARLKHYPDAVVAYGDTIDEAQKNIWLAIKTVFNGTEN